MNIIILRIFNVFFLTLSISVFVAWVFGWIDFLAISPIAFGMALMGRDALIIEKHERNVSGYEDISRFNIFFWI